MPNHITNLLTITGPEADVDAMLAKCVRPVEGKPAFDFNAIIPQPACVEGTESSNVTEIGFYALTGLVRNEFPCSFGASDPLKFYRDFPRHLMVTRKHFLEWLTEHHPDVVEKGRKTLQCFRETGCMSWYEWNTENWGTKWDAYEYEPVSRSEGCAVLRFQTAWSPPRPVLAALAAQWPMLTISVESIDEGGWAYRGAYANGIGALEKCEEDDAMYERVYGEKRERDEEDDASGASHE